MIMYVGMFADLTFVAPCRLDTTRLTMMISELYFYTLIPFVSLKKSAARDNGALAWHGRVLCDNKAAIK